MKFCKLLESQQKDFPELNSIFLRYKALKQRIRAIPQPQQQPQDRELGQGEIEGTASKLSSEEKDFIEALNEDLESFNNFFIEKEEDAVIRMQKLTDQLSSCSPEQMKEAKEQLVNFHGELVLILHWSLINYSAVVKILKKHDKRTGLLLRAPYLSNVLKQPFASTNVMSCLVKKAEELVEKASRIDTEDVGLSHQQRHAESHSSDNEGSSSFKEAQRAEPHMAKAKRTELVLEMWSSLAKGASTPSTIMPIASIHSKAPPIADVLCEADTDQAIGDLRPEDQAPSKKSRIC